MHNYTRDDIFHIVGGRRCRFHQIAIYRYFWNDEKYGGNSRTA